MTGEKRLQNVQKRRTRAVRQPAQHTILDTRRRRRNADQQSFPGGGELEPHAPLVVAIDNTLDEASRAQRLYHHPGGRTVEADKPCKGNLINAGICFPARVGNRIATAPD